MKQTLCGACAVFLALCHVPTFAAVDGNKLLQQLQSESSVEAMYAYSYIDGAIDFHNIVFTNQLGSVILPGGKKHFSLSLACPPPAVTGKQVFDVVRRHLEAHPETRHEAGAVHVRNALVAAWPCPWNYVPEGLPPKR